VEFGGIKNKNMKKSTLIGMFWGFYLGATITGLFGAGLSDPRWWIVVMPVIILTQWEKRTFNDEN
jgi:hypothetical protein